MVFAFATVIATPRAVAASSADKATPIAGTGSSKPFVAQVVGLGWMNPLQRRDYPTEWQILGHSASNRTSTMTWFERIRVNIRLCSQFPLLRMAVTGANLFWFYEKYVDKLLILFRVPYFTGEGYFYTVSPSEQRKWRELAGMHVELAVPSGRVDPASAGSYLRDRIVTIFEIGNPSAKNLWTRDTPPDVHVTAGQGNAGFTSLNAALDYLAAHPDKSAWVMNGMRRTFRRKMDRATRTWWCCFWLADMKTEREPLAWIGKAARGNVKDFEAKQARAARYRHGSRRSIRRRAMRVCPCRR